MPIDPAALLERTFAPVEQRYDRFDTIRYALGVGLGADPVDGGQLRYVYEEGVYEDGVCGDGLAALPTMVNILGYPGFWAKEADTGIDWRRLVHAEQAFVLHRPLPSEGSIAGHTRIAAIWDKGAGKGSLLRQERTLVDVTTGEALATVTQTSFLRGDGGSGGSEGTPPPPHAIPNRAPDAICDLPIASNAALLYRLNGDHNPLHADPAVAAAAGFARPILQGLCTMGIACHAALRGLLDYRADAIAAMRVRFTAPVYPGETLRTVLWRDGNVVSFRSIVIDREATVLDAGRIDLFATRD